MVISPVLLMLLLLAIHCVVFPLISRDSHRLVSKVYIKSSQSVLCAVISLLADQVNELVALIPYSDQRLQPQRT